CVELNADRFSIDNMRRADVLERALLSLQGKRSWRHRLLSSLSHPPFTLRRWFTQHSGGVKGLLPLLLLFPAAYVIRLFLLFGLAISNEIGIGRDFGAILGTLATGSITYAESLIPIWLTLAVAFLLWPILVKPWEALFAGRRLTASRAIQTQGYGRYLFCAAITIGLAGIGYWLLVFTH